MVYGKGMHLKRLYQHLMSSLGKHTVLLQSKDVHGNITWQFL